MRDGKRGFRIVVGGGLGPLPVEAQLLDEFLPEERLVNRIEAVMRVFNQYGNRKNRNMARLKFVMRERGFEWLKEADREGIRRHPRKRRHRQAGDVPEGFGGYTSTPQPLGDGALLPVVNRGLPATRNSIAGSKPTSRSRSRPATRWSRSASIRAT